MEQILPDFSRKMKNITDLDELYTALGEIKEIKSYYNAKFYLGVEIDLENRINRIERGELTDLNESESKQEGGIGPKIGGIIIAAIIVIIVNVLFNW